MTRSCTYNQRTVNFLCFETKNFCIFTSPFVYSYTSYRHLNTSLITYVSNVNVEVDLSEKFVRIKYFGCLI